MKHGWNRILLTAAVLASLSAAAQSKKKPTKAQIERGRYLVTLMSCDDCHTPWAPHPELGLAPDMTKRLSGHHPGMPDPVGKLGPGDVGIWGATNTASEVSFGIVYAANITPDKETGIGAWTEDLFIRALRTGKHKGGGRPILPPMPWINFAQATDADLKAIFAFLQSLPPVKNKVPDNKVSTEALAEMEKANAKLVEEVLGKPKPSPAKKPAK